MKRKKNSEKIDGFSNTFLCIYYKKFVIDTQKHFNFEKRLIKKQSMHENNRHDFVSIFRGDETGTKYCTDIVLLIIVLLIIVLLRHCTGELISREYFVSHQKN